MSIYDDLANSGYMNQDELRKQFASNAYDLEKSMEATNKFVDFNQYEIENSQAVLENIQIDPQFKYGGNPNFNNQHAHHNQHYQNQNYKKVFNPNLKTQEAFDDYQMPSAIKSPLSGHGNATNLDIQQNLFGRGMANQEVNASDDFLKDSTTGLNYNQPKRILQLEDEDIIQIHNQHNILPQEIKTGRFATNHTIDQNYHHSDNHIQKKSLYEDDINRFKSNNDYLQQILMQLQGQNSDPFTQQNENPSQNQIYQGQQNINPQQIQNQNHHNYQRSISDNTLVDKYHNQQLMNNKPGPQNYDLIKDNSILELAKLKHDSGNSDSATPQSNYDNQDFTGNKNNDFMSRDISYLQNQQYQQFSNLKNPMEQEAGYQQYGNDNMDFFKIPPISTNLNTVGNSIISYDKYTPNYPALRNAVPGQSYVIDEKQYQVPQRHGVSDNYLINNNKENFDQQNISQVQAQAPLPNGIHGKYPQEQQMHQQMQQRQQNYPTMQSEQYHNQDPYSNINQISMHQQLQQQQQQQQPIISHQQMQQPQLQPRMNSVQENKRKEIMSKFDDIPIKVLNKAEGYQEKKMNDEPIEDNQEYDDSQLSLIERIEHPKWKVRMNAYKEINNLFYNEYSKECLKAKGQIQETEPDYDENGNFLNKPFELYSSFLHKIISDSNLVAQFEGLNCLLAYVKFAPDIKSVVFQINGILLEKIQHNKPNLKDIILKIILNIFKKDRTLSMLPEILKRFKNKNFKIATFSVEAIYECLKQQTLIDENSLKSIFKTSQDNLSHPNKELKESTILLIQEIYKNCEDDIQSFMRNLKNLRPVQQKDIKDLLTDVQKNNKITIVLFKAQSAVPQTYTEGFSPKKYKALIEEKVLEDDEDLAIQDKLVESDLTLLTPDNFFEIPYLTQINVKKKGIETFNQELEKLIIKKQSGTQVVNKDYSQIFNVITHMLEDSNALVFMEAIKTLEYLCILLGKNIKPQKMRQFIALLTDKYKETKTGPIAAVNKTLNTIIKKQTLPLTGLFDHLINTLAHNSKNARVKQLIIEKCDQTIQEDKSLKTDDTNLIIIFKSVKEKLIGLIQKDTNASVRDAAVSLIATFKAFTVNSSVIDETINTLPKYRITEINKLAQERAQVQSVALNSPSNQKQSNENRKQDREVQSPPSQKDVLQIQSKDFFYQGKNISGQYQIHLADIILSLKKLTTNSNVSITQLQEKWDNSIENLGEQGISESKSVIISCVHWLFSSNSHNISDKVQLVEAILGLVKKIYCIDRSVETDPKTGVSQELVKAVQVILMVLKWINYQKQLENILNVLMSSAANVHQFLESLLSSYEFFSQTSNENELVQVIIYSIKWLQLKIEILQTKGVQIQELEEVRSRILSRYLNIIENEKLSEQLIKVMIAFKSQLDQHNQHLDVNEEDEDQQQLAQNYNSNPGSQNVNDRNLHLSELEQPKVVPKSIGEHFIEVIDQDFQQGLQLIKNLQSSAQNLDFQNKEIIFNKILSILAQQTKNPVQKQQQAFSMKALLWMKEEIFGIEDCYQFTPTILKCFAQAESENRDSSVELFLLNNWVKQLRLKDLIDRVSIVCQDNPQLFKNTFNWLMMHSLNGNQTEQWSIEDFRKISILLAKNVMDEQVSEFFEMCVQKFGLQKVQEFMEIQLMHNQKDYNSFINWFQFKFRPQLNEKDSKPQLKLPSIEQQRIQTAQEGKQRPSKFEDLQLNNISSHHQVDESMINSTRSKNQSVHSKLYQQMREKRKSSNQRKHQQEDDGLSKYDQIINRLEAQLHQEKQSKSNSGQSSHEKEKPIEQDVNRNFQFDNSKSSNYYQSDKSKRYQIVKTDEDEELQDCINQSQNAIQKKEEVLYQNIQPKDYSFDESEDKLKESAVKENLWKLEMEKLEQEKKRIEKQKYELMHFQNHETAEWKDKYEEIRHDHEEVISNLKEANKCYLTQVSENEDLKKQLKIQQDQHLLMMKKLEQFEEKLSQQQEQAILEKYQRQKQAEVTVIRQEQLALVERVFNDYQVQVQRGDEEIGTQKIQELLLNFSDKEEAQKIGVSLYVHYQSLKLKDQKFKLLKGLSIALESEDVLFALPLETYKTVLDFNLKVFANEKALIEKNTIRQSSQSMQRNQNEQNEVTMESQKLVSKLLNSKEFTTSLVTLFQILRQCMPQDLSLDMTEEQKHYLRVIMRCIARITKALHSENPDLIRAFDVLIEMQKIFLKNPPESLREDLPCLQEFDYVYRCLKEVSDKLMELQPHKVITFLEFVSNQPENAFIKYMNQIMAPVMKKQQAQRNEYQNTYEDYEDDEIQHYSNQNQY